MDSSGRMQIRFNPEEKHKLRALQEEVGKGEGTSMKWLLDWWYSHRTHVDLHYWNKTPSVPNSEGGDE